MRAVPRYARRDFAIRIAEIIFRNQGIARPPVPAAAVLKGIANVHRFVHPLYPDEDGITLYDTRSFRYDVYLNWQVIRGRRRWTIAHEMGHILLGHLVDFDVNILDDDELFVLDREANIFAAYFLMPRVWIAPLRGQRLSLSFVGTMKDLYGVSWDALIIHLEENGVFVDKPWTNPVTPSSYAS